MQYYVIFFMLFVIDASMVQEISLGVIILWFVKAFLHFCRVFQILVESLIWLSPSSTWRGRGFGGPVGIAGRKSQDFRVALSTDMSKNEK